jgi:hypothetical protein
MIPRRSGRVVFLAEIATSRSSTLPAASGTPLVQHTAALPGSGEKVSMFSIVGAAQGTKRT